VTPAADGGGTLITIGGLGRTATTDAAGNFSFVDLPNGTYTLTPSKSGITFTPASRTVTMSSADVTGVSFTAQAVPTAFRLSGSITPGADGSGTVVTIGGLLLTTVADAAGNFSFANVPNGTFTVTPLKSGFTFTPASRTVTVNGTDATGITFTAQPVVTTWDLAGRITPGADGSGTQVTLGGLSRTVTADGTGNFAFADVPNGTYTVTPSKVGFTFTPASRSITIGGADRIGVDFTAVRVTNAATVGEWGAPFDLGIVAVNSVLLHTGKVLMYSGSFTSSGVERVWDPATGSVTLVPNPFYNLFCSGHSQLADGRILVVGGYDSDSLGAPNANIFDPVSLSWTALPNMTYRRWYPTSTTLPDGRALVTSGAQSCLTCLADVPEIFDPATNRFTTLPTARQGVPYYPFMYVLPNGTVIDAGSNEKSVVTRALNLATGTWTSIDPIARDGHSSAMYQPGKILKTGTAADSGETGNAAATAFVLDMTQSTPAWRQVASMAFRRAFHNTTLLPDGTVLVTGGGSMQDGYDVSNASFSAELWSPVTETWQTLSAATVPRLYHSTALLLPDGRVLTAGSGNDGPAVDQRRAEIFSPPYLFKGPRPTIGNAPGTIQYGTAFTVSTPDAASIASVALIRPGAVTHGFDADQRLVNLDFTASSGSLTIQSPPSANLAPPGYYMLFLVNSSGVPSIARFVRFAPPGADSEPPTAPSELGGDGAIASVALSWTASSDNTGVAVYNLHRSTTSGFVPSLANRIAQPAATSFIDNAVTAGTYFYLVTSQDVAGNLSAPSNEASVVVLPDTTAPLVSMTAPPDQSTISGSVLVSATASDDVKVAGVQFKLDGSVLGAERTAAPYSVPWNSATTSNGSHTLTAVARDASGNTSEASIDVVVSNTAQTPTGLVAAFGFDEGSGVQVTDASGQGNTGTISSATWSPAGKFGSGLSFNGTSAWVTVADSASIDLTSGMTIEAWVNPTAGTSWRTVVLKETAGGLAYSLYSANGASRPAGYAHVGSDMPVNGTAAVPLDTWTHLAVTYDGTTLRLFVNGLQVRSSVVGGPMPVSGQPLRIGGNSVWGEYFRGLIDEDRCTSTELLTASRS
jgi:hypothetical protein